MKKKLAFIFFVIFFVTASVYVWSYINSITLYSCCSCGGVTAIEPSTVLEILDYKKIGNKRNDWGQHEERAFDCSSINCSQFGCSSNIVLFPLDIYAAVVITFLLFTLFNSASLFYLKRRQLFFGLVLSIIWFIREVSAGGWGPQLLPSIITASLLAVPLSYACLKQKPSFKNGFFLGMVWIFIKFLLVNTLLTFSEGNPFENFIYMSDIAIIVITTSIGHFLSKRKKLKGNPSSLS